MQPANAQPAESEDTLRCCLCRSRVPSDRECSIQHASRTHVVLRGNTIIMEINWVEAKEVKLGVGLLVSNELSVAHLSCAITFTEWPFCLCKRIAEQRERSGTGKTTSVIPILTRIPAYRDLLFAAGSGAINLRSNTGRSKPPLCRAFAG